MPSTVQALLIFALVLVPGFLFMAALRRSVSNLDRSDLRLLLGTIPAGLLCHLCVFPWTARLLRVYLDNPKQLLEESLPSEIAAWAAVTVFVLPIGLGAGLAWIIKRPRVNRFLERFGYGYINLLPSAWEYIFDKQEGYYVRIHLKSDGVIIGGIYSTDSFAADPPRPSDIYIEEVWYLDADGNFTQPLPTTRGAWVSQEAISYVEFFAGRDPNETFEEQIDERESTPETTSTGTQGQSASDATSPAATAEDAKASEQALQQLEPPM